MAPTTTIEEKLDHLIACIKHCAEFKPDFHAIAAEKGFTSANNAQKAFKKYVEESGKYKLVAGRIMNGDGSEAEPTTPATPSKKGGKKKDDNVKQTPKKRKLDVVVKAEVKDEENDDNDGDGEIVA